MKKRLSSWLVSSSLRSNAKLSSITAIVSGTTAAGGGAGWAGVVLAAGGFLGTGVIFFFDPHDKAKNEMIMIRIKEFLMVIINKVWLKYWQIPNDHQLAEESQRSQCNN